MTKKFLLSLALTCTCFYVHINSAAAKPKAADAAPDQPIKIGFAHIEYILSFLPETKRIESELMSFKKQLEAQLKVKGVAFQKKLQAFQQGYATMTEAVKQKTQRELQGLQAELEQIQLSSQEKMATKQAKLLKPVYEKIYNKINHVAEKNRYTHIFNADAGGVPVLLYTDKKHNISDLVLKQLGVQPPADEQ